MLTNDELTNDHRVSFMRITSVLAGIVIIAVGSYLVGSVVWFANVAFALIVGILGASLILKGVLIIHRVVSPSRVDPSSQEVSSTGVLSLADYSIGTFLRIIFGSLIILLGFAALLDMSSWTTYKEIVRTGFMGLFFVGGGLYFVWRGFDRAHEAVQSWMTSHAAAYEAMHTVGPVLIAVLIYNARYFGQSSRQAWAIAAATVLVWPFLSFLPSPQRSPQMDPWTSMPVLLARAGQAAIGAGFLFLLSYGPLHAPESFYADIRFGYPLLLFAAVLNGLGLVSACRAGQFRDLDRRLAWVLLAVNTGLMVLISGELSRIFNNAPTVAFVWLVIYGISGALTIGVLWAILRSRRTL